VKTKSKLVVLGGPMDGLEFELDRPQIAIGRIGDHDACLPLGVGVSRKHARLITDANGYWLEDVGSSNGTFVSGSDEAIEGRVALLPGATFRLGPVTMLKLVVEDVEQKVVGQAERLMRRVEAQLPRCSQEKLAQFKVRLKEILLRLDEVKTEDDLLALFRELTSYLEEAMGRPAIGSARDVEGLAKSLAECSEEADEPSEDGFLRSLKSFFKSNLGEILQRAEAEESGGRNREP
jgi:hypothetical protein